MRRSIVSGPSRSNDSTHYDDKSNTTEDLNFPLPLLFLGLLRFFSNNVVYGLYLKSYLPGIDRFNPAWLRHCFLCLIILLYRSIGCHSMRLITKSDLVPVFLKELLELSFRHVCGTFEEINRYLSYPQ